MDININLFIAFQAINYTLSVDALWIPLQWASIEQSIWVLQ